MTGSLSRHRASALLSTALQLFVGDVGVGGDEDEEMLPRRACDTGAGPSRSERRETNYCYI